MQKKLFLSYELARMALMSGHCYPREPLGTLDTCCFNLNVNARNIFLL